MCSCSGVVISFAPRFTALITNLGAVPNARRRKLSCTLSFGIRERQDYGLMQNTCPAQEDTSIIWPTYYYYFYFFTKERKNYFLIVVAIAKKAILKTRMKGSSSLALIWKGTLFFSWKGKWVWRDVCPRKCLNTHVARVLRMNEPTWMCRGVYHWLSSGETEFVRSEINTDHHFIRLVFCLSIFRYMFVLIF